MKNSIFKSGKNSYLRPLLIGFLMVFTGWPAAAVADDAPLGTRSKGSEDQIHISSDHLVSNSDDSYAEFAGNVKVTQGKTVITSDKLRIYYTNDDESGGDALAGQESIKKILATGNVTIRSEDRVAVTPKAEYDAATGIITLLGKGSKFTVTLPRK